MPYEEESKNARRRAIRYLVYRDRSRNEIIRYLNGKKFSADAVDETLTFLESNDYINDDRFAIGTWCYDRFFFWEPVNAYIDKTSKC